jgi:hypothetical protein
MTTESVLELFVKYGAEWVVVGLAALLALGLRKLQALKIGSERTDAAVDRALEFARLVVADLEATMRPAVAAAGADGKLTPEEAAKLRAVAMDRLKALMGQHGVTELAGTLNILAPQVSEVLGGYLERAVLELKATKALAAPVEAPSPS